MKEQNFIESQNNNISINDEEKDIKEESIKNEIIKEKEEKEIKETLIKNENKDKEENIKNDNEKKEEDKNIITEDIKQKTEDNKDVSEKKISSKKNNNNLNFLNSDKNNKQILNVLRDLSSRLNDLELKFNGLLNKEVNILKKELNNHDLENQSDFKLIDIKMNEILEKFTDYDKKIEDCTVKCASIDILNLIKDNGDGTIDAAKLLFKSLEDKCFKKFDLIDARYKQEALDLLKMKKNVENLSPKVDKINRDIAQIKENEEQQKEELINNKKESNEKNDKTLKAFEEKSEDLLKNMNELKEDIESNLKQKIQDLEEKMKIMGKGEDGTSSLFKLGLVGNNKVDEEKIQALEKKINDVRKKANDLENSFKIFLNEEIEVLKNDVKELKFKIDKKITKEDLKELYNLHLSDLDEINDLKDQIGITNDEFKKILKDLQNVAAKVESINGNVILLQNSHLSSGRGSIIDFTKYIDEHRLTETLRPILKEIEKIYKEMDSLLREINEVENNVKLLEKKERVNKLEEDVYSKINELKVYCNRKFPDKIDINKTIKTIEIQLKEITGVKKTDGDGWLMAKQPLKCFNCASCEANIKNANPIQEYIPWNKYPQGERIYRMGQGFSHMLQMMTSEFVKTFGENSVTYNSDNEGNNQNNKSNKNNFGNNTNSLLFHSSDKSFSGMKINNKEQIKEDAFNFYRTGGKVKLPKMKKFSKKHKDKFDESIPISDEEKDYIGESNDKPNPVNTESPKIMRITKIKSQNPFNMSGFSPKYGQSIEYANKTKDKEFIDFTLKNKIIKKNGNK